MSMAKKILFFGIYDNEYSRNKILSIGFRERGFVIGECRVDPRLSRGIKKYWRLFRLGLAERGKWDLVLVAFPGQTVMPLAWLLFPKKKIIFDAFVSLYDSNVFDRGLYSRFSWRGIKDWLLDALSLRLAGVVLLDTFEHIKYFSKTFLLSESRFERVLIGANDRVFYPQSGQALPVRPFIVYFCGHFIPLQGVEYIIEAANILRDEDIEFRLIGKGQTHKKIEMSIAKAGLGDKVKLLGEKKLEELPLLMSGAHVCLGIFGSTAKASRVIPNKVYEAVATGCPVITGDSLAEREVFSDKEILLARLADGQDLAEKIRQIKNDENLRINLARAGYEYFKTNLVPSVIVGRLVDSLEKRHLVEAG